MWTNILLDSGATASRLVLNLRFTPVCLTPIVYVELDDVMVKNQNAVLPYVQLGINIRVPFIDHARLDIEISIHKLLALYLSFSLYTMEVKIIANMCNI